MELYARHICHKICAGLGAADDDAPLTGMHIVVDAGNGDGGFFVAQVLDRLGADTNGSVYLEPNGMFPNHIPNPENKQAMASIRQAVLDSQADLGLIFDTDVDRMSAVLPNGEEISRNALIAMMSAILAPDYPDSTIVTDSVTSDELTVFLEKELGLHHHRYMRGYKNVIDECIRLNQQGTVSPLAIETSGHGALKENYYLDDGAYLAVKLLIAAAKTRKNGRQLGDLVAKLGQPAESREYRLRIRGVDDARAYGTQVLQEFETRAAAAGIKAAKPSFEGVRLVFPEGWALLRMSLHDPNMPLNIESRTKGGVARIAAQTKDLLQGFDKLDLSVFSK
jgi:phosphomannomutase